MRKLNRRSILLLLAIMALIALNLWRWWPTAPATQGPKHGPGANNLTSNPFRLEEFEVHVLPLDTPPPLQRDLFRPKLVARPVSKPLPKPEEPPPKSSQELAREAAQAEFAQLRCVGVAFRNGKAQAYIQKGSENYLVSPGDKVLNRFSVDSITPDAVTLQDPDTGVGGTLAVSGK
ncbi:MAG: hypothetical protein HY080_01290 [Gammaproteobacteria bacterium]|nr:hypothetical protein [Gammaproteobacteria bacterium]